MTQPCGFPPVHPQLFLFFSFSSPLQGARGGLPVCVERGWRGNRNLEGKNNPRNSLPPALPCFLRYCRRAGTAPWLQSPLCVPCLSPFLPTPGDSGNVTQLLSVWPRGKRSQRMGKSVTGQKQLARQRAVSSGLQVRHLLSPNCPRLTASLTPKGRMKDVFPSVGFSGVCFGAELPSHQGFWLASGGGSRSWVLSSCTTPSSTCCRLPLLRKWEKSRFTKFPSSLIPAVKEAWG